MNPKELITSQKWYSDAHKGEDGRVEESVIVMFDTADR